MRSLRNVRVLIVRFCSIKKCGIINVTIEKNSKKRKYSEQQNRKLQ